jgi:MarR family transcriptional regulator, transcriptional regulator for hemolysin
MELPKSLSNNLAFLISSVALQYRVMFDREMQPLGLTRSQWWVVAHIYYFDGVSQAKLAEILDVDKSAIARLMVRLEKKGWIERKPDAHDGRAMKVFLTPRVHRLMEDITSLSDFLVKQSVGKLSKTKVKDIQAGLLEISASLDTMIGTTSAETIAIRRRIQKDLKGLI